MYFVKENYVGGEKIMILKYITWKANKKDKVKNKNKFAFCSIHIMFLQTQYNKKKIFISRFSNVTQEPHCILNRDRITAKALFKM